MEDDEERQKVMGALIDLPSEERGKHDCVTKAAHGEELGHALENGEENGLQR